ncbi:iron complex outermembrane receptor protein [Bacteroides zoogleoformans]|uniref:TonB-dependent receptor n=1 Tax=Bacteroides zoogleoformans TaxID=28119 RepID=A0ABM6T7T6_9BACE|nr:TonB-dependent receptor [Bacteroides zoogleoformans]AVM52391.1 TonB-dependent receptor [Bacteroides zoogleoformans]TWJ13361.1 iron complex outermembrane receptor protein [Bacteroides zoogleoformans]
MRIRYILGALGSFIVSSVHPQTVDSVRNISLSEVVVTETYSRARNKRTALTIDVLRKDFLNKHFTGNLAQTIGHIPGVHSMDIGMGVSKPMIRGLGFNRIAVSENGIKQEGQQWGADHGLEIDAFNVEEVQIRKGPASLLYGSDAMGGTIEILPAGIPAENRLMGEIALIGKSVNGTLGGSLMLGLKKDAWFVKVRFSEKHFGDYRVPTDTVVYLTHLMPVYDRKLKNTAGLERNANIFTSYRRKRYRSDYSVSNAYQKMGFYPGAHGIPDVARLQDDGNSRNIELPYSWVNHFKASTHQQYVLNGMILSGDLGYQLNHREEWSSFHTHYGAQPIPEKDPDKELAFRLHTLSGSLKLRVVRSSSWEHTLGWDVQRQKNTIGGYSFLLPAYRRFTIGGFWLSTWRPDNRLSISGGIRYDYGNTDITPYQDPYLEEYLQEQGYPTDKIDGYKWRSYPVKRNFGDYSCSIGIVWSPSDMHLLKMNIGRSFRLPGANELASNGVHHGTFRHEQGDASLSSEHGWQLDASYELTYKNIHISLSPFAARFNNFIYLQPTGEWSALPHAGQIYRYTGARAVLMGGEAIVSIDLLPKLNYRCAGEYVYTNNRDDHTALSFSPPASVRNVLTWRKKNYELYVECRNIFAQNCIARNEDSTSGANLLQLGGSFRLPIGGTAIECSFSAQNILNTKYYNHLSFYRKVEIPEPGRNFQLFIKVPFKRILK